MRGSREERRDNIDRSTNDRPRHFTRGEQEEKVSNCHCCCCCSSINPTRVYSSRKRYVSLSLSLSLSLTHTHTVQFSSVQFSSESGKREVRQRTSCWQSGESAPDAATVPTPGECRCSFANDCQRSGSYNSALQCTASVAKALKMEENK